MEWGRQMAYINHYYFYIWDEQWGAAFWKTNAYGPYPVWLWLNGHEWAKRQLELAGIAYVALDNGFASCEDSQTLQRVCDRLGVREVHSFFWRWYHRLPSPLTEADLKAGYVYDLAFRQFEVSETVVFDRPQAGRMWFEGVIRDHLDIGRPQRVSLIFDRRISRRTPGRFHSRLIVKGVEPILSCSYKSSRIKQYFKQGRALRTETVICDTRDFGIGRRVVAKNWWALRAVGQSANRRLCDAETTDARPAPDVLTLQQVGRPSQNSDGLYAPGLRFGDPRVMALFTALVSFSCLFTGFTNRNLVESVAGLLDLPYRSRQATYDLRRLRRKGLIERLPHSHRYRLTEQGRRIAVLFTKTFSRVLAPALTATDRHLPEQLTQRCPLATAWRRLERAFNDFADRQMIAA